MATPDILLRDYGFLGMALGSSVSAVIYLAKTQIKRESERADRKDQEAIDAGREMISLLTDKVFPALTASTVAAKEQMELQQKVHDLLERLLEGQRRQK